jgi:hypothetical protein
MPNSLNLVGDGDELDVIYDVERTFGFKFTKEEAENLRNVGDLYDLIESKATSADGTKGCLSQAAFYQIREALRANGLAGAVTPSTPLAEVADFSGRKGRAKWRDLERRAGLTFPWLETAGERGAFSLWWRRQLSSPVRNWLSALLSAPIGFGLFFFFDNFLGIHPRTVLNWLLGALIAVPLAVAAIAYAWHLTFKTVPKRIVTVGDLAREAAGYSFAELVRAKHGSSPYDRWFALGAILRLASGHKSTIAKDTKFFVNEPA